jgi:hypothetical protein
MARALLRTARMETIHAKGILRDALIGFGIGLAVMLAAGYGASALSGAEPAAATR